MADLTFPNTVTIRKGGHSRWIPMMVAAPLLAVGLILIWGFDDHRFEENVHGSFPLDPAIRTVEIANDVGSVDVRIGHAGKVEFRAETMRAAGSEELLAQAKLAPFTVETVKSTNTSILVLRTSPTPAGFVALPRPKDYAGTDAPLFRQMNLTIEVPIDVAVAVTTREGNVRVDTRQAPVRVDTAKGTVMVLHVSESVHIRNGDGSTVVHGQRGPLDMSVTGKARVTLAAVVGPTNIVSEKGEVGLYLPRHGPFDLDAKSLTGKVRNAFGFTAEPIGPKGFRVRGKVGDGAHRVVVEARAGTLTVDAEGK